MANSHFTLWLLACLLYLGVAAACLAAWRLADRREDRIRWSLIGIFFIAVAIWRGLGIETAIVTMMRETLLSDGLYQQRRDMQRPLAALSVILISIALYLFYAKRPRGKGRPRDWSRFGAMVGVACLISIICMRIISLHDIDRLLYGPIRLNWILDVGASALVAFSAWRFRQLSRRQAMP